MSARHAVSAQIEGLLVPAIGPAVLRDINDDGFAIRTSVKLIPGATYRIRFGEGGTALVITGRLVHAMRISTADPTNWYLAGFQFSEPEIEKAAIAQLTTRAAASRQ